MAYCTRGCRGDLAEAVGLPPSAVTRTLKPLEKLGVDDAGGVVNDVAAKLLDK